MSSLLPFEQLQLTTIDPPSDLKNQKYIERETIDGKIIARKRDNCIVQDSVSCLLSFLSGKICKETFQKLVEEISSLDLLPKRYDWNGSYSISTSFINCDNLWSVIKGYFERQKETANLPYDNVFSLQNPTFVEFRNNNNFPKFLSHYNVSFLKRELSPLNVIHNTQLLFAAGLASRFELLITLVGHTGSSFFISFDKTEHRLISGSDDGNVKVWCSRTARLIHSLRGHTAPISDASCSPDNSVLVSASLDGTVRFWNIKTGEHLSCIIHTHPIQSVQFHPITTKDGNGLVCISSSDGLVYLWKYKIEQTPSVSISVEKSPRKYCCKATAKHEIRCSTFTQGGTRFVVGSTDGLVRLFSIFCEESLLTNKNLALSPPYLNIFDGHEGHVTSVHCSYRGNKIVTGSWDGTAKVWFFNRQKACWEGSTFEVYKDFANYSMNGPSNITTASPFNTHVDSKFKVLLVLWSFDDSKIITSSSDSIIRVWDVASGKLLHRLVYHTANVYILSPHPKIESLVLTAGWDGKVCLWDINKGTLVKSFEHEGRKFNDGQFNNDGTLFAIVDNLGTILLFGMGIFPEQFSQTPSEQFFKIDFCSISFDSNNNPIDSATSLPFHSLPREGTFDLNGNRNSFYEICSGENFDYGLDFPTQPSEIDVKFERDDIEFIKNEEMVNFKLESLSIHRESSIELEKKIKKRRTAKYSTFALLEDEDNPFDMENSPFESFPTGDDQTINSANQNNISNQNDDITAYLDEYHSSADESYTESINEDNNQNTFSSYEDDEIANASSSSFSNDSRSTRSAQYHRRHSHHGQNQRSAVSSTNGQIQCLREEELPSDWISSYVPKITPYFPQINDEIVYFRQGHELFLQAVGSRPEFLQDLPWIVYPDLDCVIFGKINNIEFRVGPPTIASVSISIDCKRNNSTIIVNYYDHEDISDFIILRARFNLFIERGSLLRINTRVNVLFSDGKFYGGEIIDKVPFDPQFSSSPWQCYLVKWFDGDDVGKCSPWELLKMNEKTKSVQTSFINESFVKIISEELAEEYPVFKEQVSYAEYPNYLREIAYPVYFDLIVRRLENGFYHSLGQLSFEVNMIVFNAKKFNIPGSPIYRAANQLGRRWDQIMQEKGSMHCNSREEGRRKTASSRPIRSNDTDESHDDESSFESSSTFRLRIRKSKKSKKKFTIDSDGSFDDVY